MANRVYSFLDIHASLVGPGVSISLGAGAGTADEGISVDPSEEIDHMMIGSDGTPMHSLGANKSGKVIVRLLKTSPSNAILSAAYAFQTASGLTHGQNTLTIANPVTGDVITCQQVAFAKAPSIRYGKEGGIQEWEFNAGIIDLSLGAGI